MKVVFFGTALLACAIPASGQVDTTIPANCEAAIFTPGVPSAVVVLTVPTPALPAGDVLGSPALGPRPSRLAHPGIFTGPASSPYTVGSGVVTASGIGSITTSGIGSIGTSGVGHMETSGVGSIGMGGIGSFGMSGVGSIGTSGFGILPGPIAAPVPFPARPTPSPAVGSSAITANAIARPLPGTPRRLPLICP